MAQIVPVLTAVATVASTASSIYSSVTAEKPEMPDMPKMETPKVDQQAKDNTVQRQKEMMKRRMAGAERTKAGGGEGLGSSRASVLRPKLSPTLGA